MKCGDAELEKGENSTNLSKAYHGEKGELLKGYDNKHQALQAELKKWQSDDLKILRVLVTAAVGEQSCQPERCVPPGTFFPEYFIRCDVRRTELLFGREFKTLLKTVREGGQSLSEIYDKLNEGENLRKRKQTKQGGGQIKRQK